MSKQSFIGLINCIVSYDLLIDDHQLVVVLSASLCSHFSCFVQPLHRELYSMNAASFLAPSFLKAIRDNTEESFRSIICEPSPGILVFEMFQPRFCEMLLSEVLIDPYLLSGGIHFFCFESRFYIF